MPNRILRDWTDSFKFDGISAEAERLFTRLIMKADDFGRYNAHPQLIKSGCFPLAEDLRANTVSAWLTELSDRKLVFCYTSGDRPILAIINFLQRIRDDVSPKFPSPEGKPERWIAGDKICDPPRVAAVCGLVGVGVVCEDEAGGVAKAFNFPENLKSDKFKESWLKWIQHLSQKRKKPTGLAVEMQLKKLSLFGELKAIESINQSIEQNWQGLFEPKIKPATQQSRSSLLPPIGHRNL